MLISKHFCLVPSCSLSVKVVSCKLSCFVEYTECRRVKAFGVSVFRVSNIETSYIFVLSKCTDNVVNGRIVKCNMDGDAVNSCKILKRKNIICGNIPYHIL